MSAHANVRSNILARRDAMTAKCGFQSSQARLERSDEILDGRGRGRAKETHGRQLVRLLCARRRMYSRCLTDNLRGPPLAIVGREQHVAQHNRTAKGR
jgi:hypothetical protein